MKSKPPLLRILLLLAFVPVSHGFSPYENFLQSGNPRQVGLLAKVPDKNREAFEKWLRKLAEPPEKKALRKAGISNLSAYRRQIGADSWAVLHFRLEAEQAYLEAASRFEGASAATSALSGLIDPHPRAERFGTRWLQMEWINYIRGKDVPGEPTSRLMIVTTVLPEKEMEYRTLHQTVWPGVVDQVIRSQNRDLCIFLAEIEGLLVEFLYVEYVGTDQEKDDRMSQTDALNHRWWKLTDACQKGLPSVEGNWVPMEQVE